MGLESFLRNVFLILLVLTMLSFLWYLSFYLPEDPIQAFMFSENESNVTLTATPQPSPATSTPTPTPYVDPRTIQSGFCQAMRETMNMDIYFAGYNQMRVELFNDEVKYITLYLGKDIYYWRRGSSTGTRFYYTDVFGFKAEQKERFPWLLSPFDIEKGAQNPACQRTMNVSLSLFDVPSTVDFKNYTQ